MSVKQIANLISDDLDRVEEAIATHLESDVSFISEVGRYVLSSGGKRIRPVLLILCARLGNYVNQRVYDLCTVIEFIHTATLLHDDVIDNAHLRRGNPTVNSRLGNEISILIGDYLYAKAMELSLQDKDHLVMETVARVTKDMAKGQVLETLKERDLTITEDEYYRIIALKTAALFEGSCTVGALAAGLTPPQRGMVSAFGYHLGLAFQMADDTLDFIAPEAILGKPVNNDLKEGKITLPVIMAMPQATAAEVASIEAYLQNPDATDTDFEAIIGILDRYGTLQSTMAQAQAQVETAKAQLADLSPSTARETLLTLADYVTTRNV
jgi:octaprenyl-diphosphate synthase